MLAKTFRCRFFFFSDLRCCCCFFPGFYFFFFSVPTYIYLFIRAVGPCTRNAFIPGDRPSSQRDTIFVFGIFFPRSLSLSHTLSSSVSLPPKTEVTTKEYAIIIIITTISRSAYTKRVVSAPVPQMRRAIQCTD